MPLVYGEGPGGVGYFGGGVGTIPTASSGKGGFPIRQRLFGASAFYRNVRDHEPTPAMAGVATNYFFGPTLQQATTVNVNWPLTVTQVALQTSPFNQNVSQLWTGISDRVQTVDVSNGRQYELDTVQASEATMTILDRDEAFNPTNTLSPYYPNVKIYRQIIDQAMYPPVPLNGAVNILNPTAGFDMSFESYTIGQAPSWMLIFNGTAGISPHVTNTFAFQGTQSLTWNVTNGAGLQGIVAQFNCIPGRVYTASCYFRQTLANVHELRINGHNSMATTQATNQWVRLVGTFTADQPFLQLCIDTPNATAGSGAVYVDAIQIEPGNTVNTFSTTGPTVTCTFAGYVERWPSSWNYQGTYGMAQITAVDAFAPMAGQDLHTEYGNAVLSLSPAYYWPLQETATSGSTITTFAEASGNNGPPLVRRNGTTPAETFSTGATMGIAGDQGGVGLADHPTSPTSGNTSPVVSGLDLYSGISIGSTTVPFAVTIAVWVTYSGSFTTSGTTAISIRDTTERLVSMGWGGITLTGVETIVAGLVQPQGGGASQINSATTVTDAWADGKPHLFVLTATANLTNMVSTIWVDGVAKATTSVASSTLKMPMVASVVQLAGFIDKNSFGIWEPSSLPNGVFAHLAIWNRALLGTEIVSLSTAGAGFTNETSGVRISRYLGYHYIAPSTVDTGQSTMGVSVLTDGTSLLDACQNVSTSENGVLYVDPIYGGRITFQSRSHRYLELTPKWVFGEQQANGEIPYTVDIAYDFDPTQVYNDVRVTRSGGVQAVGGTVADIAASQLDYGKRSFQREINVASDLETQDAANYLFNQHKLPSQRVSQIVVDVGSNPALFATVFSIRISDRVTVNRRTSAGFMMAADYFIERIEHHREPGVWHVTFQMSPVDLAQVGILDSATYGHVQTDGSVLVSPIGAGDTSITVSSNAAYNGTYVYGSQWSVSGGDLPLGVSIDGEKVTVTNVANIATDAFGRTVSNGWGNADSGQAWSVSGGAASDFSVGSGVGSISSNTTGVTRFAALTLGQTDVEDLVTFVIPALATGASMIVRSAVRVVGRGNYRFEVILNTNGTIDMDVLRVIDGNLTTLTTVTGILGYAASTSLNMRTKVVGSALMAKIWPSAATEPAGWTISTTDSSAVLAGPGDVGYQVFLTGGNTNTTPVFTFDNFSVVTPQVFTITRPTDGTATSHSVNAPVSVTTPFIMAY